LTSRCSQTRGSWCFPSIAGVVRAQDTDHVFFLFAGSRYIYDLYYEKEAISKQLYDWLLKNNYADAMLIAKWKKQGYEKVSCRMCVDQILEDNFANDSFSRQLCCLRCIQTKETNFNSTCICRVPREQLKQDQEIECVSCGCRGCSSND
jgi:bud site selection protein 31